MEKKPGGGDDGSPLPHPNEDEASETLGEQNTIQDPVPNEGGAYPLHNHTVPLVLHKQDLCSSSKIFNLKDIFRDTAKNTSLQIKQIMSSFI